MNTLTFTSSNETLLDSYTWDKQYPVVKIVDNDHVMVINDMGLMECVCIDHFNNGLLVDTSSLVCASKRRIADVEIHSSPSTVVISKSDIIEVVRVLDNNHPTQVLVRVPNGNEVRISLEVLNQFTKEINY